MLSRGHQPRHSRRGGRDPPAAAGPVGRHAGEHQLARRDAVGVDVAGRVDVRWNEPSRRTRTRRRSRPGRSTGASPPAGAPDASALTSDTLRARTSKRNTSGSRRDSRAKTEARLTNATKRPSPEIDGAYDAASGSRPGVVIRIVVPSIRSRTKTSWTPFLSSLTRLDASRRTRRSGRPSRSWGVRCEHCLRTRPTRSRRAACVGCCGRERRRPRRRSCRPERGWSRR